MEVAALVISDGVWILQLVFNLGPMTVRALIDYVVLVPFLHCMDRRVAKELTNVWSPG